MLNTYNFFKWVLDSNELLYTFPCIETEVKKNAFENMATALTGPGTKKNQQGHKQVIQTHTHTNTHTLSLSFSLRACAV